MHLQQSTFSDPGQLRIYGGCYFKNVFPKKEMLLFPLLFVYVKPMLLNV